MHAKSIANKNEILELNKNTKQIIINNKWYMPE